MVTRSRQGKSSQSTWLPNPVIAEPRTVPGTGDTWFRYDAVVTPTMTLDKRPVTSHGNVVWRAIAQRVSRPGTGAGISTTTLVKVLLGDSISVLIQFSRAQHLAPSRGRT